MKKKTVFLINSEFLLILLFPVIFLSVVVSTSAIQDNQQFAIPLGDTRCFDVMLPDDSGAYGPGKYVVRVNTDLSVNSRYFSTTLGEGVVIEHPICFTARSGVVESGSIVSYKITVTADGGSQRSYSGKMCLSPISDQACTSLVAGSGDVLPDQDDDSPDDGQAQSCSPGERRCSGSMLEECSGDRNWVPILECMNGCSGSSCIGSDDKGSGDDSGGGQPGVYTWVIIIGAAGLAVVLIIYMLLKSKPVKREPVYRRRYDY